MEKVLYIYTKQDNGTQRKMGRVVLSGKKISILKEMEYIQRHTEREREKGRVRERSDTE